MSITDPRQDELGQEPASDREDPPLPTRFGRARHRPRFGREDPAADRSPSSEDDAPPFEDDGGL